MNAFASGWNEKNSMIAITSTLLERLKEDELKAVIAHELSHIRHGDVRLTMCVGILSNIMLLGVNIFAFYFSNSKLKGRVWQEVFCLCCSLFCHCLQWC